MSRFSKFSASLFALIFVVGCASTRNPTKVTETTEARTTQTTPGDARVTNPSVDPMAEMTETETNMVSSIEFSRGQKNLSPEAMAELNRALSEARQQGEVEGVDIIVWSDQSPSTQVARSQTRSQIEIARQRGETIEKYVDRMEPEANVRVHNMATRPDAFLNYLNALDEGAKEQLAQAGLVSNPEADEVVGKNSSAVILIRMK